MPAIIIYINLIVFAVIIVYCAFDTLLFDLSIYSAEKRLRLFKEEILIFETIAFVVINGGIIVLNIMNAISERKARKKKDKDKL